MSRRTNGVIVLVILLISMTGMIFFMLSGSKQQGLHSIKLWAYQIQGIEEPSVIDALAESKYDLLVIEPTRSCKGYEDFDAESVVEILHQSGGTNVVSKIIIAYVNIGQAEDWRYYWNESWIAPTATERGSPDFLITTDPDGWIGDYPVAFWDERWKDIVLYGNNSMIQQVLDDGFDGIYMDWVGAFSYDPIVAVAESEGLDAQQEMIDFIAEIREYCQNQDPDFIIIQQNALDIYDNHSEYFDIIDAVAQEHVLFDGDAGAEWGDANAGDIPVPEEDTEWYVEKLQQYLEHIKIVFTIDYAREEQNIAKVYSFAEEHGYIAFVTQISLSQLPSYTPPAYPLALNMMVMAIPLMREE